LPLLVAALAGCGARPTHPTAHLAGRVSIQGQPVPQGKLVLLPLEPGHGPGVGVPIIAGNYDCPGAPTGKVLAQVYAVRATGKMIEAMGSTHPELINTVPDKDRNGREINVSGDNSQLDFLLGAP